MANYDGGLFAAFSGSHWQFNLSHVPPFGCHDAAATEMGTNQIWFPQSFGFDTAFMSGSLHSGPMSCLQGDLDGDSSEEEEDVFLAYALGMLPIGPGETTRPRYSVMRKMVKRNIQEGWIRLHNDHFETEKVYPDAYFRRRFRVFPRLFKLIADAVASHDDWFQQRCNGSGQKGAHPYQKVAAALKMLATGCSPDSLDREFRMSKTLIADSFQHFVMAVVEIFGEEFLCAPTAADIQGLLEESEKRGFPGMIRSIDCMHWVWEQCPVAWQGEHKGHCHKPTMILEVVAGPNLWFWHAYFGLPGSLNDINVLHRSPVFDDICSGNAPNISFQVNGHSYDMGYYLANGIYPDWATLVKGVPIPVTDKQKLFTMKQSAYRKDVERAFGVLQAKFAIVKGPAKMHQVKKMKFTMSCSIILHNMACQDERGCPLPDIHDFENAGEPGLIPRHAPTLEELIANQNKLESSAVHSQLQENLMMFG